MQQIVYKLKSADFVQSAISADVLILKSEVIKCFVNVTLNTQGFLQSRTT